MKKECHYRGEKILDTAIETLYRCNAVYSAAELMEEPCRTGHAAFDHFNMFCRVRKSKEKNTKHDGSGGDYFGKPLDAPA